MTVTGDNNVDWRRVVLEIESLGSSWLYCLHGSDSPGSADLRRLADDLKKSRVIPPMGAKNVVLASSRAHYIHRHRHEGLFFQQRYQATYNDQGETVRQRMEKAGKSLRTAEYLERIKAFELESLFDKPLLQLSSGEWQRFSVCEALCLHPDLLIIPYLLKGLDQHWQNQILQLLIQNLKAIGGILFTSDAPIDHPSVFNISIDPWSQDTNRHSTLTEPDPDLIARIHQYQTSFLPETTGQALLQMSGVNIRYGHRNILSDIHWTVNMGDKWNIQGPNGAGKSTLISLINSDNPQGYSQPIKLFGTDYGRHSIWERKARISYFGSDFFQYFRSSKSIEETLHQQLKTPYLNTVQPPENLVEELMSWFGLFDYRYHIYTSADRDIKRQLLLLATYLKSSDILILDEPYQDFSEIRIRQNNHFLDRFQPQSRQTVIFVTHREDHKPGFLNHALGLERGRITEIK